MEPDTYEDGATQAVQEETPSASEVTQPSEYLTEDELLAKVQRIVDESVSRSHRALQSEISPIAQLKPQLLELLGNDRKRDALLERLARNSMTEEDYAALQQATRLQQLEAENAALRTPPANAQPATPSANDFVVDQYLTSIRPVAARFVKSQSLTWAEAEPHITAIRPSFTVGANGRPVVDWEGWFDQMETAVKAVADSKHRAGTPAPRVPAVKGGSGGTLSWDKAQQIKNVADISYDDYFKIVNSA